MRKTLPREVTTLTKVGIEALHAHVEQRQLDLGREVGVLGLVATGQSGRRWPPRCRRWRTWGSSAYQLGELPADLLGLGLAGQQYAQVVAGDADVAAVLDLGMLAEDAVSALSSICWSCTTAPEVRRSWATNSPVAAPPTQSRPRSRSAARSPGQGQQRTAGIDSCLSPIPWCFARVYQPEFLRSRSWMREVRRRRSRGFRGRSAGVTSTGVEGISYPLDLWWAAGEGDHVEAAGGVFVVEQEVCGGEGQAALLGAADRGLWRRRSLVLAVADLHEDPVHAVAHDQIQLAGAAAIVAGLQSAVPWASRNRSAGIFGDSASCRSYPSLAPADCPSKDLAAAAAGRSNRSSRSARGGLRRRRRASGVRWRHRGPNIRDVS